MLNLGVKFYFSLISTLITLRAIITRDKLEGLRPTRFSRALFPLPPTLKCRYCLYINLFLLARPFELAPLWAWLSPLQGKQTLSFVIVCRTFMSAMPNAPLLPRAGTAINSRANAPEDHHLIILRRQPRPFGDFIALAHRRLNFNLAWHPTVLQLAARLFIIKLYARFH